MHKKKYITIMFLLVCIFTPVVTSQVNSGYGKVSAGCPILPQTGSPDPNCLAQQQASFGNGCNGLSAQQCLEQNSFVQKLQLIVNFLSAGVGLVVVAMIMFGGIKYITAGENSQAVQDAKNTIRNAIIALLVFALMFSFMQWLIPGGVFG